MRHCLGVAISVLGIGYVFFPGEKLMLAIAIMITILLIWLVERS